MGWDKPTNLKWLLTRSRSPPLRVSSSSRRPRLKIISKSSPSVPFRRRTKSARDPRPVFTSWWSCSLAPTTNTTILWTRYISRETASQTPNSKISCSRIWLRPLSITFSTTVWWCSMKKMNSSRSNSLSLSYLSRGSPFLGLITSYQTVPVASSSYNTWTTSNSIGSPKARKIKSRSWC